MKYPQDLRIPERVSTLRGFAGPDHDEGVCAGVDGVLVPANVIGCVINAEGLDRKYLVTDNTDPVAIFICDLVMELHVGVPTQHSCKKMLTKFGKEILRFYN